MKIFQKSDGNFSFNQADCKTELIGELDERPKYPIASKKLKAVLLLKTRDLKLFK